MSEQYFTLEGVSQGLYKEKGSKFISFAMPVQSVEEVKTIVAQYKKKYYDARHHCYAYILNASKDEYRCCDDGEPHNSAGRPIYGQLRSKKLSYSLVIVVRYFGGTKLGVGGLMQAYKAGAADALENGKIIEHK